MDPVSSWTAIAVDELAKAKPVLETTHASYLFKVYITNDSLWLTAGQDKSGKVAFRLAFSAGDALSLKGSKEEGGKFSFSLESPCSKFEVKLEFPDPQDTVFHYTTTMRSNIPMLIPFWPKDMLPLTSGGKLQQRGVVHADQVGTRSGLMYMSMTRPKTGSVFYFQNLTALNAFCDDTKTSASGLVGGEWPELGFSLPAVTQEPLPPNKDFVISDVFIRLTEDIPADDFQVTQGFMENLAAIYLLLERPEPKYHEWREIAENGMKDLAHHKGCWTFAGGHSYLNAYLCDYQTPPEVMVQLAVLLPLLEYCDWKGEQHPMTTELRDGLEVFYRPEFKTLGRWLPALEDNLDKSEEQKRERIMDSWYLHHPLTNLARLADRGDKMANELLEKSIDFVINVAKHFDYEWPVFYRMDTLEVTKAETQPGKGGEKDVPGAYAKLMLEVWKLKGEQKYVSEAKKSVKKLKGLGFDIFYQANNTAFSAVALLRLYKQTKQEWYLNLSYACIASIFKNMQLWDCNYGDGKCFPTFFSVFPLSDAPYTAAYEEQEVYATLHGYLQESVGLDILPSVKLLIAEFIKYAIARLPYYFPPMLPKEALSETVKTGEIDPALWIPLEDISDGWEKSGAVGQEVYGACLAFGIVPRQYFKIPDEDFMIFLDYPATKPKIRKGKSLSFQILGDERLTCRLLVLFKNKPVKITVSVSQNNTRKSEDIKPVNQLKSQWEYEISGDMLVKLEW